MPGFRELLAQTKKKIREVEPAEAETHLDDATFVDVRELDEYEQGTVPDSVFIPRGHLESQVLHVDVDEAGLVVGLCRRGARASHSHGDRGEPPTIASLIRCIRIPPKLVIAVHHCAHGGISKLIGTTRPLRILPLWYFGGEAM